MWQFLHLGREIPCVWIFESFRKLFPSYTPKIYHRHTCMFFLIYRRTLICNQEYNVRWIEQNKVGNDDPLIKNHVFGGFRKTDKKIKKYVASIWILTQTTNIQLCTILLLLIKRDPPSPWIVLGLVNTIN